MQYLAQAQQSQNTINTTIPYTPPAKEKPRINLLIPISGILVISILVIVIITILRRKKKSKNISNQSKSASADSQSKSPGIINNSNSTSANTTSTGNTTNSLSKPNLKHKLKTFGAALTATKRRQSLSAIVGILLIAGVGQIVYSSFAATTEYSSIPEVAKMQKLTEEVVAMTTEYATMPDTVATKKNGNQPNEAKTVKKQELIAKVKERKDAYKIAMQYDPQTTANFYLPYTTRDKLPEDAKFYTETAVDIQGYWITGTTETEKGGARTLIKLQLDDSSRLAIYGSNLPDFSPGSRVRITGIQLERSLIAALPYRQKDTQALSITQAYQSFFARVFTAKVEAIDASSLCKNLLGPVNGMICPDKEDDESNANAPTVSFCVPVGDSTRFASCTNDNHDPVTNEGGGRKILVVAMALPGEDGGIFSDGETYNIGEIKGAYNNVKNMYSTMSYGKFTPDITVYPEYIQMLSEDIGNNVDLKQDCGDYLYDNVEMAAQTAINRTTGLKQQAEDATDIAILYNNIPCDGSDGGGRQGWATVGVSAGSESQKGLTNNILSGSSLTSLTSTFAHELGHSFGLHHTGAACAIDSDNCTDSQSTYGDIYNMMGGSPHEEYTSDSFAGDSLSFNAIQKQRLGWIDDQSIVDMSADDNKLEVKLNSLWQNTGARAVSIMVGGTRHLIEYRPKTSQGIDNFNNNKLSEGILVYKLHAGSACSNGNCSVDSLLMNGNKGDKYKSDDNYYKDRYEWDYNKAATLEPFMLKNDTTGDTICVVPTNPTEEGVDVTIATTCPKDEITNYVYEKTINYPLELIYASDLKTDKEGNFYIADELAKKVYKLDKNGGLLKTFTLPIDARLNPNIDIDNKGNIYISVDQIIGRYESKQLLLKYNLDGDELARWDPGDLRITINGISSDSVGDIEVNSKGDVFLIYERSTNPAWSDYTQEIIFKFDSNLSEIKRWTLPEKLLAAGMDFDSKDNLHIFEQGRWNGALSGWNNLPENCMHKFSSDGDDITKWCKPNPDFGGDGLATYWRTNDDVFARFDNIELDKKGNYLMLPLQGGNVAMYNSSHKYIGRIGGNLEGFDAINLASDGNLYITSRKPQMYGIRVYNPNIKPIDYTKITN